MILNKLLSLSKNISLQHSINYSVNGSLFLRYYTSFLNEGGRKSAHSLKSEITINPKLKANIPLVILVRNAGFFNRLSADQLWKGVTNVSNQGKKKGRGRGSSKGFKNLNRGQIIGVGETNISFPGLNAPLTSGKSLARIEQLPPNDTRKLKLEEIRNHMGKFKTLKLNSLERGWTGNNFGGRKVGPPITENDGELEGFETIILESKIVKKMTGNLGQKRRVSTFVVTGNEKGCAGFVLVKGSSVKNAVLRARHKVSQFLLYVDICDGHTVYHDFYTEFMYTKLFVKKKHKGYGLVCHRVIREICKVLGIKDIHVKVDGAMNPQNITKAFFLGLLKQKTYQQMADEKELIVAKVLPGMPPKIMATPSSGVIRKSSDIHDDEEMNVNKFGMGGKVEIERKKFVPFYVREPSWERHLKKVLKSRNHEKIKRQLEVEYGYVRSFLTDEHPECVMNYREPVKEE